MKITPKTDKEISEKGLLSEGFYNYEIIKEDCGVSQSGIPRIHLTLRVKDRDGKEKLIWDDLCDWRDKTTKEFCYNQELSEQYENGELPDSGYVKKFGRVHVIVKPSSVDKNGKLWNAKNEVSQYLPFSDVADYKPSFDQDLNY